jgi:GNAT superfamily N-acetyltransferase
LPSLTVRRLESPSGDGDYRRALDDFCCAGGDFAEDEHARAIDAFFPDGCLEGMQHGMSTTYVAFGAPDSDPRVIGYATLALDRVRLTDSERADHGGLRFRDIGAIRICLIGVDHRLQRQGHGERLLQGIVGRAFQVSSVVAVRFLLADANLPAVPWYERNHFVRNRHDDATAKNERMRATEMRLDLLSPRE